MWSVISRTRRRIYSLIWRPASPLSFARSIFVQGWIMLELEALSQAYGRV
jgi:hypothetical protein